MMPDMDKTDKLVNQLNSYTYEEDHKKHNPHIILPCRIIHSSLELLSGCIS